MHDTYTMCLTDGFSGLDVFVLTNPFGVLMLVYPAMIFMKPTLDDR